MRNELCQKEQVDTKKYVGENFLKKMRINTSAKKLEILE